MNIFFSFVCLVTICMGSLSAHSEIEATEMNQFDIEIPVVNMDDFFDLEKQDQFLDTLYEAMTKVGFFAVRNTGVDFKTIQKAYAESAIFFKSDEAVKAACTAPGLSGQRGFTPGETAKGSGKKDIKQF